MGYSVLATTLMILIASGKQVEEHTLDIAHKHMHTVISSFIFSARSEIITKQTFTHFSHLLSICCLYLIAISWTEKKSAKCARFATSFDDFESLFLKMVLSSLAGYLQLQANDHFTIECSNRQICVGIHCETLKSASITLNEYFLLLLLLLYSLFSSSLAFIYIFFTRDFLAHAIFTGTFIEFGASL